MFVGTLSKAVSESYTFRLARSDDKEYKAVVGENDTNHPADVRVITYAKDRDISADSGTRTFRERGSIQWLQPWWHRLSTHFEGQLIPFEWVPDYVRVTRTAVQKRIRKGQLSMFVFEMEENVVKLLGGTRSRMRREYRVVPSTECDIWILSRCEPLEKSDLRQLRSPHVPGWWNDVELDEVDGPKGRRKK